MLRQTLKRFQFKKLSLKPGKNQLYWALNHPSLIFPKKQLKFAFSTSRAEKVSLPIDEDDMAHMMYIHKMKMNMYKKQATRMEFNEEYVKETPTVEHIGRIGVRLSDLYFYEIQYQGKEDYNEENSNGKSKYSSDSWLRVVFPFEERSHIK